MGPEPHNGDNYQQQNSIEWKETGQTEKRVRGFLLTRRTIAMALHSYGYSLDAAGSEAYPTEDDIIKLMQDPRLTRGILEDVNNFLGEISQITQEEPYLAPLDQKSLFQDIAKGRSSVWIYESIDPDTRDMEIAGFAKMAVTTYAELTGENSFLRYILDRTGVSNIVDIGSMYVQLPYRSYDIVETFGGEVIGNELLKYGLHRTALRMVHGINMNRQGVASDPLKGVIEISALRIRKDSGDTGELREIGATAVRKGPYYHPLREVFLRPTDNENFTHFGGQLEVITSGNGDYALNQNPKFGEIDENGSPFPVEMID